MRVGDGKVDTYMNLARVERWSLGWEEAWTSLYDWAKRRENVMWRQQRLWLYCTAEMPMHAANIWTIRVCIKVSVVWIYDAYVTFNSSMLSPLSPGPGQENIQKKVFISCRRWCFYRNTTDTMKVVVLMTILCERNPPQRIYMDVQQRETASIFVLLLWKNVPWRTNKEHLIMTQTMTLPHPQSGKPTLRWVIKDVGADQLKKKKQKKQRWWLFPWLHDFTRKVNQRDNGFL